MIGTNLGEYRIEGELGAGGMGTVYRAADAQGRVVAVKVVHPHLRGSDGFLERFLLEGAIGQRVIHENVVRTIDAAAVVAAHLEVHPERLHRRDVEYSAFIGELIGVLLEKDPRERFDTAMEVLDILTWGGTVSLVGPPRPRHHRSAAECPRSPANRTVRSGGRATGPDQLARARAGRAR